MITLKLKELLEKNNMSILKLSEETNMSRSTLNSMVNGSTKGIQFSTLNTLCDFFKCDVNEILDYTPSVPKITLDIISVRALKNRYKIFYVYKTDILKEIYWLGVELTISFVGNDEDTPFKFIDLELEKKGSFVVRDMVIEKYGENIEYYRPRFPRGSFLEKAFNAAENVIYPNVASERINKTFDYFNMAIRYWNELDNLIKSNVEDEFFVLTEQIFYTSQFFDNLDFTNGLTIPDPYIENFEGISEEAINKVKEEEDEIRGKQIERIRILYVYEKDKNCDLTILPTENREIVVRYLKNSKSEQKPYKIIDFKS